MLLSLYGVFIEQVWLWDTQYLIILAIILVGIVVLNIYHI